MISAVIYTNRDEVLNDDKYECDETGYPYFQELGNILYRYERLRKRKFKPDIRKFHMRYD
jgi:hypothetical protein